MEIDFAGVVKVLNQCVKLVCATRRLLESVGVVFPHMSELERSLRERAAEVQAYMKQVEEDKNRPLVGDTRDG